MNTTTNRKRTIRRYAAVAAMAIVPALTFGLAPSAGATTPAPFTECGNPSDKGHIWEGVDPAKGYSPTSPGKGNEAIVWPNDDSTRGYAVHYGQQSHVGTDLLVVPTIRETGIECTNLLDSNAPEYFLHAYEQRGLMTGNDWVLAINSADSRGQEQLHIHLTQLDSKSRSDIDAALKADKLAKTEDAWWNSKFTVQGHDASGNYRAHEVRGWHAGSMNHNFFAKLNNDIVQVSKKNKFSVGMRDETLLVTSDHKGGFVVLTSDKNSGLKDGVNNVETFLHKG